MGEGLGLFAIVKVIVHSLEVDVTEARKRIKQSRQGGRKISFTAWLIKTIADCVALHPPIAGVNDAKAIMYWGKNRAPSG